MNGAVNASPHSHSAPPGPTEQEDSAGAAGGHSVAHGQVSWEVQKEGFMRMVWRTLSGSGKRQAEPSMEAHMAAFEGNEQQMKDLLRDTPELLRELSGEGETPAHHAAAGGQARIVSLLADIDRSILLKQDNDGMTPAHTASYYRHAEVLRVIARVAPATFEVRDSLGRSPLDLAGSHEESRAILLRYTKMQWPPSPLSPTARLTAKRACWSGGSSPLPKTSSKSNGSNSPVEPSNGASSPFYKANSLFLKPGSGSPLARMVLPVLKPSSMWPPTKLGEGEGEAGARTRIFIQACAALLVMLFLYMTARAFAPAVLARIQQAPVALVARMCAPSCKGDAAPARGSHGGCGVWRHGTSRGIRGAYSRGSRGVSRAGARVWVAGWGGEGEEGGAVALKEYVSRVAIQKSRVATEVGPSLHSIPRRAAFRV